VTSSRRHFGNVRRLPSGWYQASYWHEGRRQEDNRYAEGANVVSLENCLQPERARSAHDRGEAEDEGPFGSQRGRALM
jgi:hypothetical protein